MDIDGGELPGSFTGVVFSNEFFDALPVEVAVYEASFREQRVASRRRASHWETGDPCRAEVEEYLRRYFPPPGRGPLVRSSISPRSSWMERIARRSINGYVFTIDYGYTRAESIRFPAGTLMGYRRHTAREDVLTIPASAISPRT